MANPQHKKKHSPTITFRRRRIKETTISATAHHHNPSAVSPENTSWCCPPAVSSYKPPPEPLPLPHPPEKVNAVTKPPLIPAPATVSVSVSPSPESLNPKKHRSLHSESNFEKTQMISTAISPAVYGGAGNGNYQEKLPSFTQFNSDPISSPPQSGKTRSSPTLFEMMAKEPESRIPTNVTNIIPPLIVIDKQALMHQRLSDLLTIRSPGNQFNDPNSSDLKLTLSSKTGLSVSMSVHRQILVAHSRFFADKLADYRRKMGQQLRGLIDSGNPYIVEIADCDDIEFYVEAIRLMYCKDLRRKLMKDDVTRVLGILKVSAAIGFNAAVLSCLEYLEAAPWAEDEEQKVASLLSELQLEGISPGDVLKRVSVDENPDNQEILLNLLNLVLEGKDEKARRDMKSLVSKMLHENSSKNDLKKESLYSACEKCLRLLKHHFLKASVGEFEDVGQTGQMGQISRQSGNLHWLLDILIDRQIAEDFLTLWGSQTELSEAHSKIPALHRYEISRVTARLFVGIGKGQLLAPKESRCVLLRTWLVPFYDDFTWMRRGSRGLDRNLVEEGLSNTILTLPLALQRDIFMSWFDRFLDSGDDCPNLQRGFEVWWKRAFWRNPEAKRELRITNGNGGNL